MTLKIGDHGQGVLDVQRALLELGEHLPRWGDDGDFGTETLAAAESLFLKHALRAHGDPSPLQLDDGELALVFSLRDQHRAQPEYPLTDVVDRRAFAGHTGDYGPRTWANVKGWCLHQTACTLSASHDIARCDRVTAHWVVYPDGRKFKLHDIDRIVAHGNGWNNQTIGIEIDGLFAGIEGDPKTVWDDPSTPWHETAGSVTVAQVEAVKQIIRADHAEILRHCGKPTVIVAHRQSSGTRPNDPGSKVWQQIAMPMIAALGLDDGGPGFAIKDKAGGLPIPVEWDSTRTGFHYR